MIKHIKLVTPIAAICFMANSVQAQLPVTQVFTNYHGYWTSQSSSASSIKPDSSHMLLGFRYNNTVFSTGVSDNVLTSNSVSFQPANFEGFVVAAGAVPAGSSAVIGVGNAYGGGTGNVTPIPVSAPFSAYLSDGVHGLDLGTAIFNVPISNFNYNVTAFALSSVGDNVPDLVVTQVGQPPNASSLDSFRFINALGATVGNAVAISLSGVDTLGSGTWKFYNPTSPVTFNTLLAGDRPLRMIAFELSDFGLNITNIATVTQFVHRLSGQSDQAFIAYNTASFSAGTGVVLPVTIKSFSGKKANQQSILTWAVADIRNFSHFEIERSNDGSKTYNRVSTINFQENRSEYNFTDIQPGTGSNLYRLKLVDNDGAYSYSTIVKVDFNEASSVKTFPNPVSSLVTIDAAKGSEISIMDVSGKQFYVPVERTENSAKLDCSNLAPGTYIIIVNTGTAKVSNRITVLH